jgi:hypothetical protein
MSVGGKVIQVYQADQDKVWLNTLDHGEPTSVLVNPKGHEIKLGDKVWWQGGKVYWTSQSTLDTVDLPKIGGSGVNHPLGKEYEITYDQGRIVTQKKARIKELEVEVLALKKKHGEM